ncbi:hypothetical protein EOA23_02490 [Mesorhizobium sp. M2A.F.Ca.ET.042.01.1.1]|uniref:hypothetical protein n=1 Tax=Mesorhizobium sp. M2A.F.Ca.ET.042.01.1.1 TaxID=2496745 RepID=UPI000FCB3582|nr:hypothetical protein [Mesorhizobium sp. M2A.F.Ca.ET.042.01.1.1]RUX34301.1 hypothetical protein EOA23_02490 [Mesorhizobium sp. M2A.F.Ca.ET.042.01.1.1]
MKAMLKLLALIAFFSKEIDKRSLLGSVERNRSWFLGNAGYGREFQHHAPPTAVDECSQVELSPLGKPPRTEATQAVSGERVGRSA